MLARLALFTAFLAFSLSSAFAQQACPIKTVPISKLNCDKGLTYVGPRNKYKYGGQCIYPLQPCVGKVENTRNGECPGGTYVGAPNAAKFGGQCIFPAAGWKIEARAAGQLSDCKPPEVFMGPAKAGSLSGHCVKIFK